MIHAPENGPTNAVAEPGMPLPSPALGTTFYGTVFQAGGADAGSPASRPGPLVLDAAARLGARSIYLGDDAVGVQLAAEPAVLVERRRELPVLAVDAALGAVRLGRPRAGRAQAASLDRPECDTAVEVVAAALALCAELGAPYVVVGLGAVRGLERLWGKLRGRFLRGVLLYDETSAAELMDIRGGLSPRFLDAALRSVDRMVEAAARHGVTILLRNPRRPVELPLSLELAALRAELRGAPLAPFLDLPAAHLTSTLRCVPLRETVVAFGDGPLANLADACGPLAGLPPGHGEIDVAAVARALPAAAARAFLPWPGLAPRELARGYQAVVNLPPGRAAAGQ